MKKFYLQTKNQIVASIFATDFETRRTLIGTQDSLMRLIRLVVANTELTPFVQKQLREAVDRIIDIEDMINDVEQLPCFYDGEDSHNLIRTFYPRLHLLEDEDNAPLD